LINNVSNVIYSEQVLATNFSSIFVIPAPHDLFMAALEEVHAQKTIG
jgi:hypothetical protein